MPRKIQAPRGFECPYQAACPHLDGLSTHWVWECYQEYPEERSRLLNQIDDLTRELKEAYREINDLASANDTLKVRLEQLHRGQFKANRQKNSTEKTQKEGNSRPTPKKRGAPKGHPPWTRSTPKQIDKTVPVDAPTKCPHCDCTHLAPWQERHQHLQEDIVLRPRTQVTCFDHAQAWCPDCRRPVQKAGEGEMIGSYIGPLAKSTAVYLRYGIGLSYRNVAKVFTDLFGLSMVPASVVGFDKASCGKAGELYEDLHQKIQASAYLHADETSWRVDGVNHWLWYAGHEELAYFHIDRHRSGEVAQEVIGHDFSGVLNTDDYAAYNGVKNKARQSCLAHPLRLARDARRTLESLESPLSQAQTQAISFFEDTEGLFKDACLTGAQMRQGTLKKTRPGPLIKKYKDRVDRHCAKTLAWEPAEKLRKRIIKQRNNLFTFIKYPEVQPTNNQAEQSLRRSVILRKITFGNRSDEGARRQAVLTSLIMTAQRQDRDPRAAIEQLLTRPAEEAQSAFYRKPLQTNSKKSSRSAGIHRGRPPPPSRK